MSLEGAVAGAGVASAATRKGGSACSGWNPRRPRPWRRGRARPVSPQAGGREEGRLSQPMFPHHGGVERRGPLRGERLRRPDGRQARAGASRGAWDRAAGPGDNGQVLLIMQGKRQVPDALLGLAAQRAVRWEGRDLLLLLLLSLVAGPAAAVLDRR